SAGTSRKNVTSRRASGSVSSFSSCLPFRRSGQTLTMTTRGKRQEPDTLPDRLGTKLEPLHPLGATLTVAAAGYVVLVAFALLMGALVTNVVVGGSLGRGDLRIERWLADRPTPTWN